MKVEENPELDVGGVAYHGGVQTFTFQPLAAIKMRQTLYAAGIREVPAVDFRDDDGLVRGHLTTRVENFA